MPINTDERPRLLRIAGNPPIEIYALVRRYNGYRPQVRRTHWRNLDQINEIALHHDGVFYSGTDRNYNRTTIDEDIARMDADYRSANERLGLNPERMPYHFMASHERLYLTCDMGVIGAHVAGHNTRTIGVCGLGNFVGAWPPLTQIAILAGAGAVTYRRLGRIVPIRGHYQFPRQSTVCPGGTWPQWAGLVRAWSKKFA